MYLSLAPCAIPGRDLALGGVIAVSGDPRSQTKAPPIAMASRPSFELDSAAESVEVDSAETLVEKLRRHYTEAFEGTALEQVLSGTIMVDQWVWSNSDGKEQSEALEKLKEKYTADEGATARARTRFLERALDAKKEQIEEEFVLRNTMMASVFAEHHEGAEAAKKAKKEEMDAMDHFPSRSLAGQQPGGSDSS